MKKTASPFSLFAATCLVLAFSHASPFAQTAPQREQLPNVDKRVAAGIAAQLSPAKAEALGALQSRVPGIQAGIDPVLKRPTYIGSAGKFLTGPEDLARGVATDGDEKPSHRIVKTFLDDHAQVFGHGAEVLTGAKISREFTAAHNEMTTMVWQQELDGIPVFKTLLIGHVTKKGELVNLSSHFLADVEQAADEGTPNRAAAQNSPAISAPAAIVSASTDVGSMLSLDQVQELGAAEGATKQQRFNAMPVLNGETVVELVWLPMNESSMRLAWQVLFTSRERGEMYLSVVDAQTGEVMVRHGLTEFISDATYNVYTSDSPSPLSPGHPAPSNVQPPLIPRTLVTIDALSLNASPNGWINDGDQETLGNNVHAHLDRDDNNQPDLPRPNGGANRVFDFPLDLTQDPSTYGDASVVNLFYWNNLFHDKLYDLGFTEAAGNFQTDNFGRGGLGGDPVLADGQDGLDLPDPFHQNNANMSTPPDGFSPRMQMYKFPGPNPDRDGDLDAEVILHEHAHGLSNRRVGGGMGLFNLQSRGMGEGWSDFYGLVLLSEPGDDINAVYAVGGYLTFQLGGLQQNYYYGIRRYPYSTDLTKNPLTFKDIDPDQASTHPGIPSSPIIGGPANEVHNQGEVWCVTLWDARALLINKYGFSIGNQLILQLVTDGMNLTPANPTFLQARDGILQADHVLTGGENQVELWAAFARRGMGALAGSPASTTTAGVIESYDVPGLAYSSTLLSGGNGNGIIDFNECNNLQITLTNIGASASNITVMLTTTTPEVIVAQPFSLYPNIPNGGSGNNFSPFRISTSPTFVCGTEIELALIIKSDSETRTNFFRLPSGEVGSPIRFNNNTVFPIPDNSPVGASSPIVVSNFNGTIGKVTVGLHITHTFTFDLQLLLISPDGTEVILSQNNGGAGDNYGVNCNPDGSRTHFDDDAFMAISAGITPFVGVFQPDQPLSTFNLKSGTNANGTWQLKVVDQIGIDTGAIQCWSLFLSPQSCTDGGGECPGSDLAVTMTAAPDPAITFSNLTYSITVTNHGPSGAKSVVLSQTLPPNVIFVSATNSQGTAQHSSGTVTCNLGLIPARGSATVDIIVIPTETGFISSTASVGSSQTDPDPSNNSVTLVTRVVPESADLGVTISDAPDPVSVGGNLVYTISVTNRGPTTANNVRLTNALPSTAAFISTSSTQGSFINTGGTIIYSLGDIENAAGAVVTIVVRPTEIGAIFATSHVGSDKADLFPGNNSASATTTVTPSADLALSIVDNPDPAVVGADITYTLTLTNGGPNSAPNVTINGILPSNGQYQSSDANLIVNGNTFSLLVAQSFSSGSSFTVSIVIKAPDSPAELTLSATASASQADPNLANNSASATTIVAAAAPVIAPDGSTLITESFSPANGSVDSGETVDVALRLRNIGNISTTDVTATLLAGNGVVAPSGPQSYGIMTNGSAATSRTFRFTANGTNGQTITATLLVQDGSGLSTNVNFSFTLPTTHNFSNTNLITIFNVGPANPYPSLINVSGVTGLVDQVKVTLNKINHTYPEDIDILLVDPTGRKTMLMSDAGGANQLNNTVLTFDSTAATALADSDQLVSGNFRPADYTDSPADSFTNAPAGPYSASLDVFAGTAPNGEWSLYVVDDTTGDLGNIAGGWSLAITTIKPVNKIADLNLAVTAASSALVNETVSYTYFITNNGPDTASNVTLSTPLPANATAISATLTSVGDLAPGSNATVTVTLTATATGLLTNTASIFSSEVDLNLLNNSASAVTAIGLPAADLGISISADSTSIMGSDLVYTIVVTNNGPDTAHGVVVTNRLPATTTYVSASTPVSVAGGVVTSALGTLGAGNAVSFTITTTTLAAGNITNSANVVTTSIDGNGANNSASFVTSVAIPTPNIIASGTHLDAENLVQNASIDPGETVTISLALANIGSANTANLVATILATGGVAPSPSATQNYGVLVNNGPAVSRPFTFTASGAAGGIVTATLQLQDGANNLGTVTFTFDLPQIGSFTNATAISIPSSGPATPYPSTITVTGANGVVSKVTVGLKGLTHTFPDDLDILLVSPGGQKMLLMSDVGGSFGVNGVNLNFDSIGVEMPDAAQIVSSTYSPTDFDPGEFLAPPAPGGIYAASFAIFNGSAPNGDWSLYVNDDTSADFGSISGGWTLNLTTINPINQEVINTEFTLAASLVNGECHLIITGQSGKIYRIEASTDLANWTSISTNVAVNGEVNVVDAVAPSPRFYRAVLVP